MNVKGYFLMFKTILRLFISLVKLSFVVCNYTREEIV